MKKAQVVDEVPGRGRTPDPSLRFWSKVNKRGPIPRSHPELGPCWMWTKGTKQGGYGMFRVGSTVKLAHRVAYEMEVGPIPEGLDLDHRCRVHGCVRPDHLRPATRKENSENQAPTSNSKSGVRGVVWNQAAGKWEARVFHHGKYYYAGIHARLIDAAEAVRLKRIEVHTHNDTDRH